MNIFITGANGFLGKKVVKKLIAQGHNVRALVIPEDDTTHLASYRRYIDIVRGDMTKPETLNGMLDDMDVVIHLAAILNSPNKNLNFLINYEGTKHIADLAEKAGVKKFIFTSSSTALGQNPNVYGQSKKQAEEYLAAKNFIKIIMRPALIYGKGGLGFGKMIELTSMLPFVVPMIGSGKAKKQPIYVDDAAEIIVRAAIRHDAENKSYMLGGPETASLKELLKMIMKAKNQKKMFIHAPVWLITPILAVAELITKKLPITREAIKEMESSYEFDHTILEREFEVELTPLEKGIQMSLGDGRTIVIDKYT